MEQCCEARHSRPDVRPICRYFGTDNITFTIGSEYPNQVLEPREYTTFSSAAIEIANSRIYGGIHFPTSGPAGLIIGVVVSRLTRLHIPVTCSTQLNRYNFAARYLSQIMRGSLNLSQCSWSFQQCQGLRASSHNKPDKSVASHAKSPAIMRRSAAGPSILLAAEPAIFSLL